MSLPSVTEIIQDGNLGLVSGSPENSIVKMGVCTNGTPYVLQSFGSMSAMQSALGMGSLVENLAYEMSVSGGPVFAMPLPVTQAGSIGSVTHIGSGTGTLTAAAEPVLPILIDITTGGALGTAQFKYSVNSDAYSAAVTTPLTGTYHVLGTFTDITFGSGTYVLNDSYTMNTDGTTVHVGSGAPSVTQTSQPIDTYDVLVTIVASGALGAATATYSLDDGYNTSPTFTIPSGGVYVLPNTGVVLTFAGSFVANDTYEFKTCGPTFSNADMTTGFNTLNTTYLQQSYSLIEIVKGAAFDTAAHAATAAALVETGCDSLFTSGIDVRAIVSCPTLGSISTVTGTLTVDVADTDTTVQSAFANTSATRIAVCAGDCLLASPITGLTLRRNAAWVVSARAAGVAASQDVGAVADGGVHGVVGLFRDENATPALDAARFTTLRTIVGDPGFFITRGLTMASLGSDYAFLTNARVIDKAAFFARQWGLPLINSKIPTTQNPNAVAGSISAGKAAQLNASLDAVLEAELVSSTPQDAVAAKGLVDTTHNILADGVLPVTVSIQPFAYARTITITLGLAVRV